MKRLIVAVAALMFMLALFVPLASASAIGDGPVAQDPAAEDLAAYKTWYEAYNAKDWQKALDLAKAYVEKFPKGTQIEYMKKWIPQARSKILGDAVAAKNLPGIIKMGKEILSADPESLDFALYLAAQLRTLDTGFQYSADLIQFTETSIRLIEAGKTPTPVQGQPAFDKNKTLAFLQDSFAAIDLHNQNPDKALEHYEAAAGRDPMNPTYFYNCGRLYTTRYNAAQQEYAKIPDADKSAPEPKPEVKAAADRVDAEADGVINCWARFLGLTATDLKGFKQDQREAVKNSVTSLYEYRNNGKQDGLAKLIQDNATSPTPVKMPTPVKPPPQKAGDEQGGGKPGTVAQPAATAKPVGRKPRL